MCYFIIDLYICKPLGLVLSIKFFLLFKKKKLLFNKCYNKSDAFVFRSLLYHGVISFFIPNNNELMKQPISESKYYHKTVFYMSQSQ